MIEAIRHLSPNGWTDHGDLFTLLAAPASIRTAIDEPGELALTFLPGQLITVKTKDVLRCEYEDGSFTEWRVSEVRIESPGLITQVSAEPIWTDLDASVMRRTTALGDITLSPILHGLTTQEALSAILSPEWNRPSRFRAGTVPSSLQDAKPIVQGVGITHLEAIRQLCEQVGCEWELRREGLYYYVDLVSEVGTGSQGSSTNPFNLYGEGEQASRITLRSTDDADLYTRIVPLAGDPEFPVNISDAWWTVDTTFYSPTSNQTTVTLREEPYPVRGRQFVGDRFGTSSDNYPIANAATPNVLFLTGDASSLWGKQGRFLTPDGQRKAHIDAFGGNHPSEATLERAFMMDVEPFDNILAEAGVAVDMSEFTSGWPDGTSALGSAAAYEVTDPLYVTWGTKSVRVNANTGDGIRTKQFHINGADDYYSLWARLRVESGRVALDLVDTTYQDRRIPGDRAYAVSGPDTELGVGGMELSAGSYRVELRALEDNTVFYLDALTLTATVGPVRYQPEMGVRYLFVAGLRQLIRDSDRALSGALEAEYLTIPVTSDIKLGSYVRLRDARYKSGNQDVWGIEATGRVVEMTEEHSPLGHFKKAIRLSRRSRTAADRIAGLSTGSGFGSSSPQTASAGMRDEEILDVTRTQHYTKSQSDNRYAIKGSDGTIGGTIAWDNVLGKPTSFTPAAHTHDASDITSGTFLDARIPGSVARRNSANTFTDVQTFESELRFRSYETPYTYTTLQPHTSFDQDSNILQGLRLDGHLSLHSLLAAGGLAAVYPTGDAFFQRLDTYGAIRHVGGFDMDTGLSPVPSTPDTVGDGRWYVNGRRENDIGLPWASTTSPLKLAPILTMGSNHYAFQTAWGSGGMAFRTSDEGKTAWEDWREVAVSRMQRDFNFGKSVSVGDNADDASDSVRLLVEGNTLLEGYTEVRGSLEVTNNLLPEKNYAGHIGLPTRKWHSLSVAELRVETLVADERRVTMGGRFTVGQATYLTRFLPSNHTTIYVRHNTLNEGDIIHLEDRGQVEFMRVTSDATFISGTEYSYTVERDLDGTGPNVWGSDDSGYWTNEAAIFNTGQTGDGFIDLYAINRMLSKGDSYNQPVNGPGITFNERVGNEWDDIKVRAAVGRLDGVPTDEFGTLPDVYGLYAENVYLSGTIKAKAGDIGGWTIVGTGLWKGEGGVFTGMRTGAISFFTGAVNSAGTGAKVRLNRDGSGYLAGGNISWTDAGDVTFAPGVSLSWDQVDGRPTSLEELDPDVWEAIDGLEMPDYITSTHIDGARIESPEIAGNTGTFSGYLTAGSVRIGSNVDGTYSGVRLNSNNYWYANSSSAGSTRFRVGNNSRYMEWTGSQLNVVGDITSTSGAIGGWLLGSTTLTGGDIELSSSGFIRQTDDKWRFNSDGSGLLADGAIEWNADGEMYLTGSINASNITADLGTIGGLSLYSDGLFSDNLSIDRNGSIGIKNRFYLGDFSLSSSGSEDWVDAGQLGGSVNNVGHIPVVESWNPGPTSSSYLMWIPSGFSSNSGNWQLKITYAAYIMNTASAFIRVRFLDGTTVLSTTTFGQTTSTQTVTVNVPADCTAMQFQSYCGAYGDPLGDGKFSEGSSASIVVSSISIESGTSFVGPQGAKWTSEWEGNSESVRVDANRGHLGVAGNLFFHGDWLTPQAFPQNSPRFPGDAYTYTFTVDGNGAIAIIRSDGKVKYFQTTSNDWA